MSKSIFIASTYKVEWKRLSDEIDLVVFIEIYNNFGNGIVSPIEEEDFYNSNNVTIDKEDFTKVKEVIDSLDTSKKTIVVNTSSFMGSKSYRIKTKLVQKLFNNILDSSDKNNKYIVISYF